jgi:hypothetical protein
MKESSDNYYRSHPSMLHPSLAPSHSFRSQIQYSPRYMSDSAPVHLPNPLRRGAPKRKAFLEEITDEEAALEEKAILEKKTSDETRRFKKR